MFHWKYRIAPACIDDSGAVFKGWVLQRTRFFIKWEDAVFKWAGNDSKSLTAALDECKDMARHLKHRRIRI